MKSLLQQLENNEAVLLMYLAGELPADDQTEVEALLERDGGLRASLAALQTLQDDVNAVLAAGDVRPRGGAAAGRFVAAQIRRQHAEKLARPAAVARHSPRLRWALYPVAAAAAVAIIMGVWWQNALDPSAVPANGLGVPSLASTTDASDLDLAVIFQPTPETNLFAQLQIDPAEAEMQDAIALRELTQ